MIEHIITAFGAMLTLKNMLFMLFGVTGGMIAGGLPGLTATMSVALIVPFTFSMDPITGLVTIGAIYCGAIFGGAFSAILVNAPGTPSSIGTTFDGYPMTKQGRGEEAILTATWASAGGGIIGTIILIFLAVPLSEVAIKFGPPEYFWVSIFGLTIITSLASKSILKGVTGGILGLLISMIGIAPIGGDVRFTMGIPAFQGGVQLISVLIGFFCIPEMLKTAGNLRKSELKKDVEVSDQSGVVKKAFLNVFKKPINFIRSSIIGALVGVLPGAGGSIANLVAYNEAQKASDDSDSFGTGNPQGVVATEAANNATIEGGMVPLLTLGIPGSPPAAIIYGALMLQGLRPGPELFSTNAKITYAFMLSLFVANVMMFVVGALGGKTIYKVVTNISNRVLVPSIIFLTILGSYSIRNNIADVVVMLVIGLIGYVLKELGFQPGPVVLGLILGPIAEKGLVQGYLMGMALPNPWLTFFTRPISITLICLTIISGVWPLIKEYRERKKGKEVTA
ncbi:tripartite tricarboxylate transporter permease [Selenihalanaerobacter shriftii]|uniref:Putative tricarboxylic transport membrane protein n=1 Tax=Selenihalanaerobacter shriftii TaxID=142842 RepID=A0A1T4K1Z1_9FIRM|nr:tripartite tricarboxylate transporter permease [Selenihalanaerobacter shriftii]SJZ36315.1 putative tricarboxylic transport membrane protein [Selenihalanaerobacter shriftii]